jgi:F-type H+-transporting ATPase subunit b
MDSLISTFHIDLKLLIAQLINFGVIFVILYFLVFKPLFKTTGERSAKIEKSLKEAKEIEERLAKAKDEHKEMINLAKHEAAKIIDEANKKAEIRKGELVEKAKEEIGLLINREKAKMQTEKATTLKEIKAEVADLIALGLQKVLGEKSSKATDEKLIAKTLKEHK